MRTLLWRQSLWVIVFGLFWAGGCTHMQTTFPGIQFPFAYFNHTVRWPGENFIQISWWYTGSGNNWQHIANANPSLKPRRIHIGETIRIPVWLMNTWNPMPKNYRIPVAKKRKSISAPVERPLPHREDIELFGPVDSEVSNTIFHDIKIPAELETSLHRPHIQMPDDPRKNTDQKRDMHEREDQSQKITERGERRNA